MHSSQWTQQVVLSALLRDLVDKCLGPLNLKPDVVFFTGDLANKGAREEYRQVDPFLRALMEELELDISGRLFCIPGNHDVNRQAISATVRRSQSNLIAIQDYNLFREEVGDLLDSPAELALHASRLNEYCNFLEKLSGNGEIRPELPFASKTLSLGDFDVGIASLCSAWSSGPDEDKAGRIILGERQVRKCLENLGHTDFRIALLHHPLEWLCSQERESVTELVEARNGFNLVLRGHLHRQRPSQKNHGRNTITVASGALFADSAEQNGFVVGRLNRDGYVTLFSFAFSSKDGGFWHRDDGWSEDGHALNFPVALDLKKKIALTGLCSDAQSINSYRSYLEQQSPGFFVPTYSVSTKFLDALQLHLSTLSIVIVEGLGGAGKTRGLVEVAGLLENDFQFRFVPAEAKLLENGFERPPATRSGVLVFDNAHRRSDLQDLLPWIVAKGLKVVLLTRPGYEEHFISIVRPFQKQIVRCKLTREADETVSRIAQELRPDISGSQLSNLVANVKGNPGLTVLLATSESLGSNSSQTLSGALYEIAETTLQKIDSAARSIAEVRRYKEALGLVVCGREIHSTVINELGESLGESVRDLADLGVLRYQVARKVYGLSSDVLSDALFRRLFCHPCEVAERYSKFFHIQCWAAFAVSDRHDYEFLYEPLHQCVTKSDSLDRFECAIEFLETRCAEDPVGVLGCLEHICHLYPERATRVLRAIQEIDWNVREDGIFMSGVSSAVRKTLAKLVKYGPLSDVLDSLKRWLVELDMNSSNFDEIYGLIGEVPASTFSELTQLVAMCRELLVRLLEVERQPCGVAVVAALLMRRSPSKLMNVPPELSERIDSLLIVGGPDFLLQILTIMWRKGVATESLCHFISSQIIQNASKDNTYVEFLANATWGNPAHLSPYARLACYAFERDRGEKLTTLLDEIDDLQRAFAELHLWSEQEGGHRFSSRLQEVLWGLYIRDRERFFAYLIDGLPNNSKLHAHLGPVLGTLAPDLSRGLRAKVADVFLLDIGHIRSIPHIALAPVREELARKFEARLDFAYHLELVRVGCSLSAELASRVVTDACALALRGEEATNLLLASEWMVSTHTNLFLLILQTAVRLRACEDVLCHLVVQGSGQTLRLPWLRHLMERVSKERPFCRCCAQTLHSELVESLQVTPPPIGEVEEFCGELLAEYLRRKPTDKWNFSDFVSRCLAVLLPYESLVNLLVDWAQVPEEAWRVTLVLQVLPWHPQQSVSLLEACLKANPSLNEELLQLFAHIEETMPPMPRDQFFALRKEEQLRRARGIANSCNDLVAEFGRALIARYSTEWEEETCCVEFI